MTDNRKQAIKLVSKAVSRLTDGAVSLSDLADTYNLCNGLDHLAELIEDADELTPMSELLDLAQEIAAELLEDEGALEY